VVRLPHKKELRSHLLPPSLRLREFFYVTVSPGESRARVCGWVLSAGQVSLSDTVGRGDTAFYATILVEQQGIFWLTSGAGTRVTGDLARVTGKLSCAWPFPDGLKISRLMSEFPPCTSLPPLLSWSYVSPGSPG